MMISRTATAAAYVLALGATVLACRKPSSEGQNEAPQKEEPITATPPPARPTPTLPETPEERAGDPGNKASETETTAATAEKKQPGKMPSNLPPFEGEIKLDVRDRTAESLEYAMKDDKIRIGLSSTPGKADKGIDAIIDTDDQKATILFNEKKEFVEVDLGKVAEKAKERLSNIQVDRTGKMHTVGGRSCEEWNIRDRDVQVTACVMKGAPYFDLDALEAQAGFTAPGWAHSIVDAGYVPLRVRIGDPSGKSWATSEISEASRQVDTSKFDIPTGYKKVEPPNVTAPKKK